MPISDDRSFAFIHIQRTGGVALVSAMRDAGVQLDYAGNGLIDIFDRHPNGLELLRRFRERIPLSSSLSVFSQDHLPAVRLRELVGAQTLSRCLTFAFVRNPLGSAGFDLQLPSCTHEQAGIPRKATGYVCVAGTLAGFSRVRET